MSARRGVVCPKADVDDVEVLDEINRLLATTNDTTVNTSIRLPAASTRLGRTECRPVRCCPSTTTRTTVALRQALETLFKGGERGRRPRAGLDDLICGAHHRQLAALVS